MALRHGLRDPGGHIGPGELRERLDKLPRSGFVQQAPRGSDAGGDCPRDG